MKTFLRPLLLAGLIAVSLPVFGESALPSDVSALVIRTRECVRWSEREIKDAASDSEVLTAMTQLKCETLVADDQALRVKYVRSPLAIRTLDAARDSGP